MKCYTESQLLALLEEAAARGVQLWELAGVGSAPHEADGAVAETLAMPSLRKQLRELMDIDPDSLISKELQKA